MSSPFGRARASAVARLLAVVMVALACTLPARAGDEDVQRAFTVEIGARDEELREDCSRRLFAWWDEIASPANAPKDWDEKKLGPWSLVARTSGGGVFEERPGLVHGIVQVVAEGLPSREATADAFAEALLAALKTRVLERAMVHGSVARTQLEEEASRLQTTMKLGQVDVRLQLEAKKVKGDVVRESDDLAARLSELRRDRSETRIALAVAAKRLEAARAAAERAAGLERLRREADRIEAELAASQEPPGSAGRDGISQKLEDLRRKVDELAKTTPSTDSAREEVFRGELETIGLEARAAAIAGELTETGARIDEIQALRHFIETKTRETDAAKARLDDVTRSLNEMRAAGMRRGSPFDVIRRPGPPSKVFADRQDWMKVPDKKEETR